MIANDFPGTSLSLELLAILGDVLIKGAVMMFAAGLITTAMRKTSAAARHLVWATALSGVLVLPILSAVVPTLRLPILPGVTAVGPASLSEMRRHSLSVHATAVRPLPVGTVGVTADRHAMPRLHTAPNMAAAPATPAIVAPHRDTAASAPTAKTGGLAAITLHRMANRWPMLLLAIWGIGVVAIGLAGLIGHLSVARRLARARTISTGPIAQLAGEIYRELKLRRPTRIALDENLRIPLAHGVFRPCVLLPTAAESWPREKLRTVLLHELAHVARWDCASLFCGLIACILHWPDPLVWWGWRRLRSECERACDDAVLRCATAPTDYAENLLAIARSLHSASLSLPLPATLAMARPSELQGRIAAILDDRKNRRPISVRLAVGMLIGGALVVASCAALHLQASPPLPPSPPNNKPAAAPAPAPRKTMTLTVTDKQTGKPLAGVKVHAIIHDQAATTQYTDAAGMVTLPVPRNQHSMFLVQILPRNRIHLMLMWMPHHGKPQTIPRRYAVSATRGIAISGHVVDKAGKPVPRAHVRLMIVARQKSPHTLIDWSPITVLTNSAGVWRYDGVPATGCKNITVAVWDYKYVWGSQLLHLQTFQNLAPLRSGSATFALKPGVMVHGMVRGPDGKPMAGVRVLVAPWRFGENIPSPMTTDSKGRFSFAATPGHNVILTATAKHFGAALAEFTMRNKPRTISISLTSPHELMGRVVNRKGVPLADVNVYVDTWRGFRTLKHNMRTDTQGRFVWRGAPAGKIGVNVNERGYPFTMDVHVQSGKPNVITLRRPVTVHGTVVNAKTGQPIKRFTIIRGCIFAPAANSPPAPQHISWDQMNPKTVAGNSRFIYTLPNQRAGYALRIVANGYLPTDSRLFHNNKHSISLKFALTPAHGISTTVLNPDGSPAAGATAVLVPARKVAFIGFGTWSMLQGDFQSHVGAHGHVHFTPQQGPYLLAIYDHMGYTVLTRKALHGLSTVKLKKWASIRGKLLFGTKPAPHRNIQANISMHVGPNVAPPGIQWQIAVKTDAQGRFTVPRIPAGTGSIAMAISQEPAGGPSAMGSEEFSQPLVVKPGNVNHIIVGRVGRTVEGQIDIPKFLARRRNWYFQIGDVMTKMRPVPMPANVKHGTPARQLAWFKAFAATPKGRALLVANQKWWQLHAQSYGFIVRPDHTFAIHNVLPGTYRIYLSAVHIRHPRATGVYSGVVARVAGTFTVPPIPGGVTDVPLKIPPLKLVLVKTAKPADPPAPAPKRVHAVKTVPAMATVAAPPAQAQKTISGRVNDDLGNPIAGAHVVVSWHSSSKLAVASAMLSMQTVLTNASGVWRCPDVPVKYMQSISVGVWDYHYVFAPSPGFQNGIVELQSFSHLKKLLNGTAVFILHRGIMVQGVVRGPDGKPVAGAAVAVGPDRSPSNALPPIMTDARGRFAFAAKSNRWGVVVTATAQGFGPALMHFSVSKGQKPVVLQLSPSHTLTGQVVNLAGLPLAGAMVYTDTWRGYRTLIHAMRTDYNGRFVWNGAPAGEILVDAQSHGYAYTMDIPTRPGKANRITLRPILKVFGTVVSAKTGRPIHKFRVIRGSANSPAYPSSSAAWNNYSASEVTDDGHFTQTFPSQYPAYAIRIEAKGYRPADSKLFANDGRALHLRFRLQRATDITARVLNPDGTPAVGAKALLVPAGMAGVIDTAERSANSPPQNIHTADKMGRLVFAPPATGYDIAVYNQLGYADWSSDQPPKNGVVKLKRWGSIRGQVLLGTKAAPKQEIHADIVTPAESNGAGPTVQWQGITRTDAGGKFFISHMPAGNARLAVVGKERFLTADTSVRSYALQKRVRVESGKTSHITLGGVGCTVDGVIRIPTVLADRHDWYFVPGNAFINPPPPPASLQLPMPEDVKHGPPTARRQWRKHFLATAAGKAFGARYARWWRAHRRRYNLLVRRDGTFTVLGVLPGTYTVRVEARSKGSSYLRGAIGTVHGIFTVPPIPGGVTDVPLKIPPLKLVPVKSAKP